MKTMWEARKCTWEIYNYSQVSEQSSLLDGDAALGWENKGRVSFEKGKSRLLFQAYRNQTSTFKTLRLRSHTVPYPWEILVLWVGIELYWSITKGSSTGRPRRSHHPLSPNPTMTVLQQPHEAQYPFPMSPFGQEDGLDPGSVLGTPPAGKLAPSNLLPLRQSFSPKCFPASQMVSR